MDVSEARSPICSTSDTVIIVASPDKHVRDTVVSSLQPMENRYHEAQGGAHAIEIHSAAIQQGKRVRVFLDRNLPDLHYTEVSQMVKQVDAATTVHMIGSPAKDQVPVSSGLLPTASPSFSSLCQGVNLEEGLPGMIGESEAIQRVYRLVRLVAPRDTTVLITGDTGTGKELIARAIHLKSNRAKAPFITVNCSAIPDTLLESELFGYVKGAFTGATQQSVGRIKAAEGGTIFLDEIGELSPSMQAKLLRFLQEGEVQRLGELKASRVDVRVVAATNIDLTERAAGRVGGFRQDLYYRLAVFPVELPRLRERGRDSLLLARYFLRMYGGGDRGFGNDAEQAICQYSWPGNVRELQHTIERAVILAQTTKTISASHLGLSINQLSFF